jgi:potassium-dependent mechanosensitive channel
MRTQSQQYGYQKHRLALFSLVTLLLAIWCRPHNTFALEDENWRSALQQLQQAFQSGRLELKDYNVKLNSEIKEFKKGLSKLEKKKNQMMLWFGGSYDPEDLNHLLKGINRLRSDAEDLFKPFGELERNLENSRTKLDELEAEIGRQLVETPTPEYTELLTSNLSDLSTLKFELGKVDTQIGKIRDLSNNFSRRLNESEAATRDKLSRYSRIFYLQPLPSVFSKSTWSHLGRDLGQWLSVLEIVKDSLQGEKEWSRTRNTLFQGMLLASVLMLLGWLLIRKVRSRTESFGPLAQLFLTWTLLSFCVSTLWVDRSIPFTFYAFSSALNEMLFAAGLVSLSSFLRSCGRRFEDEPPARNPFRHFWVVLVAGLWLQALSVPYGLSLVFWVLVLITMGLRLRWSSAGARGKLERIWTSRGLYFFVGMTLLALVGCLPLSVIITVALFYLMLTVAIGLEVWRLLRAWEVRAKESERSVYFIGCISGIGFPICILGLFFLNMWLISSRLGGAQVFLEILSFKVNWRAFGLSLKEITLIVVGFYLTKTAIFTSDTFFRRLPRYRPDLDQVVVDSLLILSRNVWWALFGLYILFLLGIDLTNLAVIVGGLSVGIGFGLQHIVNNFFSGLILLAGRSIQSGDTIQIGNTLGDVRKVTIRNTVVQTRENATLFVPNSDLISNQLINWSHRDPRVVREINIGVAYGTDTGKVTELLLKAAGTHPNILNHPPPEVLFWNFGASTLDFKIKFWIDNVDNDTRILSDIRYEIDRLFRENGIEFAYPQSDVHLRTAPALEKLWASGK